MSRLAASAEKGNEMTEEEARKPTRIQSVDRAARLLMLIASDPHAKWKARTLAAAMSTSVPTMYHLLNTLVDAAFLSLDEQGIYQLGIAVGRLAEAYHSQSNPPPELLVPLRGISEQTGETAYLSAWRNGQMEVIVDLPGTLPVRVTDLKAGFRGVAHARAAGKVLLAFGTEKQLNRYLAISQLERVTSHTVVDHEQLLGVLDEARQQGYAVEYEEFCEGVGCLSVPILGESALFGAYTVSAPIDRLKKEQNRYLDVLRAAAQVAGKTADAATSPHR
jgi:IclR family transcriptional regulator, acetate operon repressor